MKRTGYDSSAYDKGVYGNVKAVLGDNHWLWLLPVAPPSGDGLSFASSEDTPLCLSKDMEAGRDLRKKSHEKVGDKPKSKSSKKGAAGTGECAASESGQDSESNAEHSSSEGVVVRPNSSGGDLTSGLGGSS